MRPCNSAHPDLRQAFKPDWFDVRERASHMEEALRRARVLLSKPVYPFDHRKH